MSHALCGLHAPTDLLQLMSRILLCEELCFLIFLGSRKFLIKLPIGTMAKVLHAHVNSPQRAAKGRDIDPETSSGFTIRDTQ